MNYDTFGSLLVEKSQVIYKYLLKLGVEVKDAEDIVQDTLYKAMFLMEDISLEKLTLLLRVAINQYRDLYRKSKRFNPVPIESVILIGQKSLDEIILTKEFQVEIQEVLETMNPDYKNILLLKYDYELSYKEISSLLDMKEETIKTNLYRARNQFKALYRGRNMSRKDFELDMDDKQMKSLLKKAKRKHLLRNWIISMCASIVVIIGIYISSIYFSQKTFIKMEIQRNVLHSVKGPNILFNGHTKLSMGLTGGTIIYSSYKNIAGQPVKWIDEIYEYSSIWGYSQLNFNGNTILDEESGNKKDEFETLPDYNSQTMQREMRFYLPFVTYRNYVNDLKNIGELQNKVGEIAISFDKAYTVEQIEKCYQKMYNQFGIG